jgi:2-keto-3-deoxy-L-rhamnonate aldolase RhmA
MALDYGQAFRLTLLTDDPALAAEADIAGVARIGIDIEHLGKAERQGSVPARHSTHVLADLARLRPVVRRADLFIRVNPLHSGTQQEVERALQLGATAIMLPYFRAAMEAEAFIETVRGRAKVLLLVETATAVLRIREIAALPGVDEIMIGLNDLRLEFRVPSHFEVLASPMMDMLAREVRRADVKLGIGALARADATGLPIPADLVVAQYPRLGATSAWIARSFFAPGQPPMALGSALDALRARLSHWAAAPPAARARARDKILAASRAMRAQS